MLYTPEIATASIVLVGKFNPAIFQPAWFAKIGVLSELELESVEVQVIHPEISQFHVQRIAIEVQIDKFSISTRREPFVSILDDVRCIFAENLKHTPVRALGINYHVHFRLPSSDLRMKLGRALAPVTPWGTFGRRITAAGGDPTTASGMVSLTMLEASPTGRERGSRRVEIQPSRQLDPLRGVYMSINDHFELVAPKDESGCAEIVKILSDNFDGSMREARIIVSEMMDFASSLQ